SLFVFSARTIAGEFGGGRGVRLGVFLLGIGALPGSGRVWWITHSLRSTESQPRDSNPPSPGYRPGAAPSLLGWRRRQTPSRTRVVWLGGVVLSCEIGAVRGRRLGDVDNPIT